jgi:HlyD family secretion protein
MSDVPKRRSWRDWYPRHLSIRVLMVLVLILGCGLGWVIRGRLKEAEAAYQRARLLRQVAEMAVIEYERGIFKQELDTVRGEIALADAERKRAEDRIVWSDRMYEKGHVSKAQNIADKVSLQQKVFAFEQARTKMSVLQKYTRIKTLNALNSDLAKAKSDELAKKAVYDRLKLPGFMFSW